MNGRALLVVVAALSHAAGVFLSGMALGNYLAIGKYDEQLSTSEQIADVRVDLESARCEERIVRVLMQIDLSGWGKWATADGEITLFPEQTKQAAGSR